MGSTAGNTVTPGRSAAAMRSGVWLTDVSLVVMALIWGVNFSVVKYGTTLIDPLAYNGFRVSLAALVLVAIIAMMRTPLPPMRTVLALMALGVLGNGVYQLFFVEGLARTSATDGALVIAAAPAFIAIIGRMRGVERVSGKGVFGIVLSIAGIALIVLAAASGNEGQSSLFGDLLVLLGSLSWAAYTVLLKPYTERVNGMQLSAFTMIGGAVPLLVVAAPGIVHTSWSSLPTLGWAALVYSGVFALVVAYYFWYNGVRVLGPTRTSMYSNLQPVIAVLVAWVLLHETPTVWQGVGTISIMAGLILTRS